MSDPREEKARASLARIYAANYDKIMARVAVVEEAMDSLSTSELSADLRKRAEGEAHKLAGVLGTFGIPEGTRLAREIEVMLRGIDPLPPQTQEELARLTSALRVELKPPPA